MDPRRVSDAAALATWITAGFKRARIERLELSQRSATGETAWIASWYADDFEGNDPEQLADAIVGDAYKDAEHQRGTTRYQVLAFKDGEELAFMRWSFRLAGGRTAQPAMVILDHVRVSAPLLARMTRHVVGLLGCAAEAIERTSSWVATSARTFSEGGDVRYQRGD
jgi:hypothetical protein